MFVTMKSRKRAFISPESLEVKKLYFYLNPQRMKGRILQECKIRGRHEKQIEKFNVNQKTQTYSKEFIVPKFFKYKYGYCRTPPVTNCNLKIYDLSDEESFYSQRTPLNLRINRRLPMGSANVQFLEISGTPNLLSDPKMLPDIPHSNKTRLCSDIEKRKVCDQTFGKNSNINCKPISKNRVKFNFDLPLTYARSKDRKSKSRHSKKLKIRVGKALKSFKDLDYGDSRRMVENCSTSDAKFSQSESVKNVEKEMFSSPKGMKIQTMELFWKLNNSNAKVEQGDAVVPITPQKKLLCKGLNFHKDEYTIFSQGLKEDIYNDNNLYGSINEITDTEMIRHEPESIFHESLEIEKEFPQLEISHACKGFLDDQMSGHFTVDNAPNLEKIEYPNRRTLEESLCIESLMVDKLRECDINPKVQNNFVEADIKSKNMLVMDKDEKYFENLYMVKDSTKCVNIDKTLMPSIILESSYTNTSNNKSKESVSQCSLACGADLKSERQLRFESVNLESNLVIESMGDSDKLNHSLDNLKNSLHLKRLAVRFSTAKKNLQKASKSLKKKIEIKGYNKKSIRHRGKNKIQSKHHFEMEGVDANQGDGEDDDIDSGKCLNLAKDTLFEGLPEDKVNNDISLLSCGVVELAAISELGFIETSKQEVDALPPNLEVDLSLTSHEALLPVDVKACTNSPPDDFKSNISLPIVRPVIGKPKKNVCRTPKKKRKKDNRVLHLSDNTNYVRKTDKKDAVDQFIGQQGAIIDTLQSCEEIKMHNNSVLGKTAIFSDSSDSKQLDCEEIMKADVPSMKSKAAAKIKNVTKQKLFMKKTKSTKIKTESKAKVDPRPGSKEREHDASYPGKKDNCFNLIDASHCKKNNLMLTQVHPKKSKESNTTSANDIYKKGTKAYNTKSYSLISHNSKASKNRLTMISSTSNTSSITVINKVVKVENQMHKSSCYKIDITECCEATSFNVTGHPPNFLADGAKVDPRSEQNVGKFVLNEHLAIPETSAINFSLSRGVSDNNIEKLAVNNGNIDSENANITKHTESRSSISKSSRNLQDDVIKPKNSNIKIADKRRVSFATFTVVNVINDQDEQLGKLEQCSENMDKIPMTVAKAIPPKGILKKVSKSLCSSNSDLESIDKLNKHVFLASTQHANKSSQCVITGIRAEDQASRSKLLNYFIAQQDEYSESLFSEDSPMDLDSRNLLCNEGNLCSISSEEEALRLYSCSLNEVESLYRHWPSPPQRNENTGWADDLYSSP